MREEKVNFSLKNTGLARASQQYQILRHSWNVLSRCGLPFRFDLFLVQKEVTLPSLLTALQCQSFFYQELVFDWKLRTGVWNGFSEGRKVLLFREVKFGGNSPWPQDSHGLGNILIPETKHVFVRFASKALIRLSNWKQSLSAKKSPYCSRGGGEKRVRRPESGEQRQKQGQEPGPRKEEKGKLSSMVEKA